MEERARACCGERVGELASANHGNNIANTFGGEIGKIVVVSVFFDGIIERLRHDTFA